MRHCSSRKLLRWCSLEHLGFSELVASSSLVVGGLCRENVQESSEGLLCFLRQSKTDQMGLWEAGSFVSVGGCKCQVRCLKDFSVAGPDGKYGLLIHHDMSLLSRYQFGAYH